MYTDPARETDDNIDTVGKVSNTGWNGDYQFTTVDQRRQDPRIPE